MMVLEREETARARGAHIYACGRGLRLDLRRLPSRADGSGRRRDRPRDAARDRARRAAGRQIGYVNYHGTSTQLNDAIEVALREARSSAATRRRLPGSSTKSMIGHPQGASGAGGMVAAALAHALAACCRRRSTSRSRSGLRPRFHRERQPRAQVEAALCNCLGFGSKNSAIVLGRRDVAPSACTRSHHRDPRQSAPSHRRFCAPHPCTRASSVSSGSSTAALTHGGRAHRRSRAGRIDGRHPARARRRARPAGRSRPLPARQAVRRHAQSRGDAGARSARAARRRSKRPRVPLEGMLRDGRTGRRRARHLRPRPLRPGAHPAGARCSSCSTSAIAAGAQFQDGVRVDGPLVEEAAGRPTVRGAVLCRTGGAGASRLRVPAPVDDRRRRTTIDAGLRARAGPPSAGAAPLGGRRLLRRPDRPGRRWARCTCAARTTSASADRRDGLANVCLVTPGSRGLRRSGAAARAAHRRAIPCSGRAPRRPVA